MPCPNLREIAENKGNLPKIRVWSHVKHNTMNEIFNFLGFKVFIHENEFEKMEFQNPLGILCIPQNI